MIPFLLQDLKQLLSHSNLLSSLKDLIYLAISDRYLALIMVGSKEYW